MNQNTETVSIIGTYSGMDEIGETIGTIALTWDRLKYFKNLMPPKSEKTCGHGDNFLYIVVVHKDREFILQCITTARFDNPKNLRECMLSQEALHQLEIDFQELPIQIHLKEMKMSCKEGAETEQFIMNLARKKDEKEQEGAAPALGDHLQSQIDEIISPDSDME